MKTVRLEELQASYAVMPDRELVALAADQKLVTDEARQVLDAEIGRRGLSSQEIDAFRKERAPQKERRRVYKIALAILFWVILMLPSTPLFIAVVSFQAWVYLWTQHFGAATRGPLEPSANASIALAIFVWIAIIIIGIVKIRELRRR